MNKAEELKSYLPIYYNESRQMNVKCDTTGMELDNLFTSIKELAHQCFPQTATWGIKYWEEYCGIPINESLDLSTRRSKVISKISQVSPITKQKVETALKTFVKDSFIEEVINEYTFRLNINGEYKFDLQQLRYVIEDMKPSHLAYCIRYFINYIYNYKFSIKALTETKVNFYTSIFNISTNLLLNGIQPLDGSYYLNGCTKPDGGINILFYFITQKVFLHLLSTSVNTSTTILVKFPRINNISNNINGRKCRFKGLNGKYSLNGSINLSNELEFIQNI